MRDSGTHWRFRRLNSASTMPSADITTDGSSIFALRMSEMLGVNGISTSRYASSSAGGSKAVRTGWRRASAQPLRKRSMLQARARRRAGVIAAI
ncbi:MAG: hypothetical protein K0S48_2777 [Ramlibacter sp.]|nr:hypothetical protein [Ramlibacter sp.]